MHEDSIWKVIRIHSGWKFCENRKGNKDGFLIGRVEGLGLGFKGLGVRVLGSRFRV